jgi:hypothetical protein
MGICTVFVLYSGLTLATYECQSQLFYGDGLISPHEVVYTSHIDECWEGYTFFVLRTRIDLNNPHVRVVRYHNIQRRFYTRVRYKKHRYKKRHKKYYKHGQHIKYRKPRVRKRQTYRRNTYNRTVIHRHYYNNTRRNNKGKRRKGKRLVKLR